MENQFIKDIKNHIGTEIQQKKKKDIEYSFNGSIRPMKGHTVYEINKLTLEISKAEYVRKKDIDWQEALRFIKSGFKKEVLIKSNCVYISSLNKSLLWI